MLNINIMTHLLKKKKFYLLAYIHSKCVRDHSFRQTYYGKPYYGKYSIVKTGFLQKKPNTDLLERKLRTQHITRNV